VSRPHVCPKCGSDMKPLSIILDSYEINKILNLPVKIGKSPSGFEEKVLN
jgi:hypothetical protein